MLSDYGLFMVMATCLLLFILKMESENGSESMLEQRMPSVSYEFGCQSVSCCGHVSGFAFVLKVRFLNEYYTFNILYTFKLYCGVLSIITDLLGLCSFHNP